MIKIYRKITTVKAERFDGSWTMAKKYLLENSATASKMIETKFYVPTLEGRLQVHTGDWIATGVDDEHWPIADEVFKKTYAGLPVIPKFIADWIDYCHLLDGGDVSTVFLLNDDEQPQGKFAGYVDVYVIEHADIVARAWLDGYQVEEDK